jgi:hypothetical protein
MSISTLVTITSANANVYVANTAGVIAGVTIGDIFSTANVLYTQNRRVTKIYPGVSGAGNVVVLDANVSTTATEYATFQHQTTGTGLWGATGIEAYFIKSSQSYSPEIDPRLPKHSTITTDLESTSDTITVANIDLFPDPGFIFACATATSDITISSNLLVRLSSLSGVELGQNVTTANIGRGTSVRVSRIYRANSSILLSNVDTLMNNVTVSSGETVYFDPTTRVGGIRIGQEVIWYDHSWTANSALTSMTRNIGNTQTTTATILAGNLVTALGTRILNI